MNIVYYLLDNLKAMQDKFYAHIYILHFAKA